MPFLIALIVLLWPAIGAAQTCEVRFTVEITQGVGTIRPGTRMEGRADYTLDGRRFRQEGGTMAHMAQGEMRLGDTIAGPIWTLIASTSDDLVDKVAIFARDVTGLTVAGVAFDGPMAVTLFALPGTRGTPEPPMSPEDWAAMDLRRAFFLQTGGVDMLAGDVTALTAVCS